MEPEFNDEDRNEDSNSSPFSISGDDIKLTATHLPPSPKKSKRSAHKRVVSVPITDPNKVDGYPPSDDWAWRKYGQKPIKGSPYPRGYYRCSSSKGCPARKQVERSRVNPTKMVITYAFEHNHPLPTPKHRSHHHQPSPPLPPQPDNIFSTQQFPDLQHDSIKEAEDLGWLFDFAVLDRPTLEYSCHVDADLTEMYSMEEDDDSLFADLGELPECSVVFGQPTQRCDSLAASVCGSSG